jgi:pimeloyl-ACP methyl ester carboxylesterase
MPSNESSDVPERLWDRLGAGGRAAGVFFPRHARTPRPKNAIDYDIPIGPGVTLGARWHLFDAKDPTILAFHGNGETVSDYDDIADAWHRVGLNLFIVDYRGYGWSGGAPTMRSLYEDPAKIAQFFLKELGAKKSGDGAHPSRPLLFGRSLGSSPASRIAVTRKADFRALILESGFGEVKPLLELFGIDVGDLHAEANRLFSNVELLKRLQLPVLILHGSDDQLLPPANARASYASVPHAKKVLQIIEGAGHNDMLRFASAYFGAIRDFLQRY